MVSGDRVQEPGEMEKTGERYYPCAIHQAFFLISPDFRLLASGFFPVVRLAVIMILGNIQNYLGFKPPYQSVSLFRLSPHYFTCIFLFVIGLCMHINKGVSV
jgi:hypothetical protein